MALPDKCTLRLWTMGLAFLLALYHHVTIAQPLSCPPSRSTDLFVGNDTAICLPACILLQPQRMTTDIKSTSTYKLLQPAYLPFPYAGGTPVLTNMDDVWSEVIPLPFEFCFFGKKYRNLVIGANGNVSFNISLAYGAQPYAVDTAPHFGPSYNNCIMGAYYDVDPSKGGQISYQTYGTAPCRTFVISWNDIPLYKCDGMRGTQQIVLYESTYVIDVFIQNRPECMIWEKGKGVLGIQNEDATMAYIFPGRNAEAWNDVNAAYRFLPDAQPEISYKWYDGRTGFVIAVSDTVTVCPKTNTVYLLEATVKTQCDKLTVVDSVSVSVNDNPAFAAFDFELHYGCSHDTLICKNKSAFTRMPPGGERFFWSFGDGGTDTARDPVHVYDSQGDYIVSLTAMGVSVCENTITHQVNIRHGVKAGFGVSTDSLCGSGTVLFYDSSKVTRLYDKDPSYRWLYNDGYSDVDIVNPSHFFQNPGHYLVMQIVGNAIPCYDSIMRFIIVDSIPDVDFTLNDSVICMGKQLDLQAIYTRDGFNSLRWDFGDGNFLSNRPHTLYTYDRDGYFRVSLTAMYNTCPDTTVSRNVRIKPAPVAYLGPDTTICPGSDVRYIEDMGHYDSKEISRVWNTGDTTKGIHVRNSGIYIVTVNVDGCTGDDTLVMERGCYINIPNAFSPNGDGDNDVFLPLELASRNVTSYELNIFNRWGQAVFVSTNSDSKGWDGKCHGIDQPFGVYVYMLRVRFQNNVREYYQGNLTLIR